MTDSVRMISTECGRCEQAIWWGEGIPEPLCDACIYAAYEEVKAQCLAWKRRWDAFYAATLEAEGRTAALLDSLRSLHDGLVAGYAADDVEMLPRILRARALIRGDGVIGDDDTLKRFLSDHFKEDGQI